MSGRITAFGVCLDCWPVLPFALFVLFVTELCFSVVIQIRWSQWFLLCGEESSAIQNSGGKTFWWSSACA